MRIELHHCQQEFAFISVSFLWPLNEYLHGY